VTQPAVSRAVFTSAWTEFCRTDAGQDEYLRRFGDYLFNSPPTEIPSELLLLPPPSFRPSVRRRQRAARKASIRSLIAAAEKAGKPVTSVTMPDGTVLHFGEPAPMTTAVNSLDLRHRRP
jgi:hypothetical protein